MTFNTTRPDQYPMSPAARNRPVPPPRRSTWGVPDNVSKAYGYPPSKAPSLADRVEYLERLTGWLADQLDPRP